MLSARTARFQGTAATTRAQNLTGATVVAVLASIAVFGAVGQIGVLMFFAIGAGAGYSLSGSV